MVGALLDLIGEEVRGHAQAMVGLAEKMVTFFHEQVLPDPGIQSLLLSEECRLPTHYMGLVDEEGAPNFYHGALRIVSAKGDEIYHGPAGEALSLIEEHTEPWTYVKFPYLKELGWKGFSAGEDSGIYRVGPLARINCCDFIDSPLAEAERQEFMELGGGKPVHVTLAYHWARLIETLHAAEKIRELLPDPDLMAGERVISGERRSECVGFLEAPRGTLIHHYRVNDRDQIEMANLIVSTTHNNEPMNRSVRKVAADELSGHEITEGMLNRIEVAIRAYDPCLSCATHAIGQMPLVVSLYDAQGQLLDRRAT